MMTNCLFVLCFKTLVFIRIGKFGYLVLSHIFAQFAMPLLHGKLIKFTNVFQFFKIVHCNLI